VNRAGKNRPAKQSSSILGPTELVLPLRAAGRIAAEQLTPYPPGIPAVPGERLNDVVLDYLRTGRHAGMAIPDATDTSLEHILVTVKR
jgi:arginine decarboxylase